MSDLRAGWYDDPDDPAQLRYWDGVLWTEHRAPKKSPTVDQSTIGMPQDVAARRPHASPPGPPAHPSAPKAPSWPQQPGASADPQQPGQYPGQQYPGQQYPGQYGGQYPGQQWQQVQLGRPWPTTPDGVPLSGWWRRVLARVVDWFAVFLLALPLNIGAYGDMGRSMSRYFEQLIETAQAGGSTAPVMPPELVATLPRIALVTFFVYGAYEIGLIGAFGATLGKRVAGISVRLPDRPGPPPWGQAAVRFVVKDLSRPLSIFRLVSLFGSVFAALDSLWPLWDPQKQALHDKAARTLVVRGQQPRNVRRPGSP